MFKKIDISGLFSKKKERLYKVVYKRKGKYAECTLLVTSKDTIDAVKRFYRKAGLNDVEHIVEFTEINYDKETTNSDG